MSQQSCFVRHNNNFLTYRDYDEVIWLSPSSNIILFFHDKCNYPSCKFPIGTSDGELTELPRSSWRNLGRVYMKFHPSYSFVLYVYFFLLSIYIPSSITTCAAKVGFNRVFTYNNNECKSVPSLMNVATTLTANPDLVVHVQGDHFVGKVTTSIRI